MSPRSNGIRIAFSQILFSDVERQPRGQLREKISSKLSFMIQANLKISKRINQNVGTSDWYFPG